MATTATAPAYAGAEVHAESGLWSWLTTVDHKRIAALYLGTSLFWFLAGGLEAAIIRLQLALPNGHIVSAEKYNELFTMHGTTMIFLVVMPLSAAFFNLLIPLQIGARDVAFPRLNAFSYWVYLFGSIFMNVSWFVGSAPDGGWFGYTPLTTLAYSKNLNIDFWVLGLQILGVSSLAAGFNFITTRKIIVVPCIVNSMLNVSADTTRPFGPISCRRMITASSPPTANQDSAVKR